MLERPRVLQLAVAAPFPQQDQHDSSPLLVGRSPVVLLGSLVGLHRTPLVLQSSQVNSFLTSRGAAPPFPSPDTQPRPPPLLINVPAVGAKSDRRGVLPGR